jgi:hypothetical protein
MTKHTPEASGAVTVMSCTVMFATIGHLRGKRNCESARAQGWSDYTVP